MERARVAISSLSDSSLTRLPQLVELLRKCISENTILCLSRFQAKLFAIVTTCRHFGNKLFCSNSVKENRIIIISPIAEMDSIHSCMMVHSSFKISVISEVRGQYEGDIANCHVIIATPVVFLDILERNVISFTNICLLVFNECHLGMVDDYSVSIIKRYKSFKGENIGLPLILAVTTVLNTMYIEDSQKLEQFLNDLGQFYEAGVNVDRTMLSSKFSVDSKLKEQLIVCKESIHAVRLDLEDSIITLTDSFLNIITNLYPTISSSSTTSYPDAQGSAKISYLAVSVIRDVIHHLGPFCAAKIAENFVDQIDQHYSCNVPDPDGRKMLTFGSSTLRQVCQIVENYYMANVICLEDILPLVPRRVIAFLTEFKKWKPSNDFKITPATVPFDEKKSIKSKNGFSDDEDDDDEGDDDDFSDDMSSDSTDGGMGKGPGSDMPGCTPVDPHTFRRHRRQANIRMMKQIIEGTVLSALVVVKTPYEAYALATLIDEICKYDGDLYFLKVGHYTSLCLQEGSSKSLLLAAPARLFLKYQSNVLHRFRQRRLNVLVTTDLHGTSVTLPPINHVVRLSVPFTYESYIGSKSFCQTQNAVMTVIVDEKSADCTQDMLQVYRETENVLSGHCVSSTTEMSLFTNSSRSDVTIKNSKENPLIPTFFPTGNPKDSVKVTADNAIMIVNRYCAKLPSDVFTRLTSLVETESLKNENGEVQYRVNLTLPVISPLKLSIPGSIMPDPLNALKSAAVETCKMLFQQGELDEKLNPVTFEVWKCEDLRQEDFQGEASTESTSNGNKSSSYGVPVSKRKQYYSKKLADILTSGPSLPLESSDGTQDDSIPYCRLYQIRMIRHQAPHLTLVDRAYDKLCCPRHYGFLTTAEALPKLPKFPIFTRYCDIDVTFELVQEQILLTKSQLDLLTFFHRYIFQKILRIEKDVLYFDPMKSHIKLYLLPLTYENDANSSPKIDWGIISYLKDFKPTVPGGLGIVLRKAGERFNWDQAQFEDAVVYRSYCGFVAHDFYYVVNVRNDYSPKTQFPSDQFDDFVNYYESKYRLMVTNTTQPLLDVDHTTSHLNMILPRRCGGKIVPPTDEENAQRLWFVPELCGIHPLPASMWHKAACLPTIFYRLNSLLIANENMSTVNAALGLPDLTEVDDGVVTDNRMSLLDYSQLRVHQTAAIQVQAKDISHWLFSEPLLQTSPNNGHDLCAECVIATESVVFKTLWLYFKPENNLLSCLICHNGCKNEFHAIAHLRHRHSWLYTQPWTFRADSHCKLCQAMTDALALSHKELQPCEQPISSIHCDCETETTGVCRRLSSQWEALKPKIAYLSVSKSRPPSICDVLTAMTASNANDMFSYERLETVGDSFLKFTVTAYLFCTCPGVEEGKLTYMRSRQVCNLNLFYRGKSRGLPERMIVSKFEPCEAWLPPGYVCLKDEEFEGKLCDPNAIWKGPEMDISNGANGVNVNGNDNGNGNGNDNGMGKSEGVDENGETVTKPESVNDNSPQKSGGRGRGGRFRRGRGRGRGARSTQQSKSKASKSDDESDLESSFIIAKPESMSLHTHQSLSDKNIADCVEAMIAAYLVSAGHEAALHVITWFGIKVLPLNHSLDSGYPVAHCVDSLQKPFPPLLPGADANSLMTIYQGNNMRTFESLIGYHFKDKAYLVQAFCHASFDLFTKRRLTDSYQRLELLGDAILDYLITRHMYELHSHYSPGVLTDLRSALVNNNIFSSLAVRWSFHRFLLYASPGLFDVVVEFVNLHKQHGSDLDLEKLDELEESGEALECPKVLGDIFESVAGAIYLDSGSNLETVWLVYYRMLKPVIDEYTANIPKSPVRELLEREPETARFLRPERTIDGRVKVVVNVVDKGQFTGVGRNFRLAKNAAARRALRQIKTSG